MLLSSGFLVFFIISHKGHRLAWNSKKSGVRLKLGMKVSDCKYNAHFYPWLKATVQ